MKKKKLSRRSATPLLSHELGRRVLTAAGWRFFPGSGGGTSRRLGALMFVSLSVCLTGQLGGGAALTAAVGVSFGFGRGAAGFGFSLSFSLVGRRKKHTPCLLEKIRNNVPPCVGFAPGGGGGRAPSLPPRPQALAHIPACGRSVGRSRALRRRRPSLRRRWFRVGAVPAV